MIIEDELSRTKLHREQISYQIERMKKNGAPQVLIEMLEKDLAMTATQYKNKDINLNIRNAKKRSQYAKENPMVPEVVDELFKRYDKISEAFNPILQSSIRFNYELRSRALMCQDDWDYCLYDPFIDGLQTQYIEKHKDKFEEYNNEI